MRSARRCAAIKAARSKLAVSNLFSRYGATCAGVMLLGDRPPPRGADAEDPASSAWRLYNSNEKRFFVKPARVNGIEMPFGGKESSGFGRQPARSTPVDTGSCGDADCPDSKASESCHSRRR